MKKGFTLTELLGVIIILGLIALITMPILTTTISKSEQEAYEKQVDIIEKSARQWGVENIDSLPEVGSNKKKNISLDKLLDAGKIQNNSIIDPRNDEEMNGCVIVSYNSEYNQYEYNYNDDTTYCESLEN